MRLVWRKGRLGGRLRAMNPRTLSLKMSLSRRGLAVVVLLVGGCAHWQTEAASPEEILADEPERIMVTTKDGSTVFLAAPTHTGDTISGRALSARGKVDSTTRVTVPLDHVSSIATWYPGEKGIAYGFGIALIGLFIGSGVYLITIGGGG